MRSICSRYARTTFEAEDIFQEAFIKVFSNIGQYKGEGSLEGWIKKVFINTSIDTFKKNIRLTSQPYLETHDIAEPDAKEDFFETLAERLSNEELIEIINKLPSGYRMIFNLHALENYTHKDIAHTLGINEGTSKSQLSKARQLLKFWVLEYVNQDEVKTISLKYSSPRNVGEIANLKL